MPIAELLAVFCVMLAAVICSEPLARWLRLPYATVLVIVGFAGSEIAVALGLDTGVRAGSFHDLVFYVFLPVLVFEAAYRIDQVMLFRNLGIILFLAVFGMLGTAALSGFLLFHGIGHPTGFPLIAALLCGAILAATDPAAVVAQVRDSGGPRHLGLVLEGESLFNDATAIVLFGVFIALARMSPEAATTGEAVMRFGTVFFGGAAAGLLAGAVGMLLLFFVHGEPGRGLVTVLVAYGSFYCAEHHLAVSGVMAALVAGLVLSWHARRRWNSEARAALDGLWEVFGHLTNALVFLIMGVTVTVAMFQERWLAMLIAIAAVLLARVASIFASFALAGRLSSEPVTRPMQWFVAWSGMRGAITLALALTLPVDLDYWWTIQSIAFGVVLFSLLVQAPTSGLVLRQLGLAGKT